MIQLYDLKTIKIGKKTKYFYNNVRISKNDLKKSNVEIICEKCLKKEKRSIISLLNCKEIHNMILCRACASSKTLKLNYGVSNVFQLESVKNKIKTNRTPEKLNILGKKMSLISKKKWDEMSEEQRKARALKQSVYKNSLSIEEKQKIENKRQKTLIERYGVESIGLVYKEIRAKSNRRWGVKKYLTKFNIEIKYNSMSELLFITQCEELNINVKNGPTIEYELNEKLHLYYVDFEIFDKYIVEIKGKNHHYYDSLNSGELDAKNKSAEEFCIKNNKIFLYLLDYKDYKLILEKYLNVYNNSKRVV